MSSQAHPFVWYELMTTDAQAAEAFYADVVGWRVADAGMPGMSYALLSAGEHLVGGLMALPAEARAAGARPTWLGYVGVSDVDASAARVLGAGGQVKTAPQDIPGVGRFATVADPQGAVFVLFQGHSGERPVQPPPGTPGTVGWHELLAADRESAWAFYAGQFGWTLDQAIDMGPMGVYQLFATGGQAVGGMMTRPPEVPMPYWRYYFNVAQIDAAIGRVTAGGGQVQNGPMQVPGGSWVASCQDPQGAMFALVAPAR